MSPPPSARARVRDMVTDLLKAGVPEVEGRVFRARTWAITEDELPAILVYGWDEEKEINGESATGATFAVSFFLAVQVRVADGSAQTEAGEQQLEELSGIVTDLVLKSPELLLPPDGPVERIGKVKTTLGVDTAQSELALGRAAIVFEMKWHEVFEFPVAEPDCGCDSTSLTFRAIPAPSAP